MSGTTINEKLEHHGEVHGTVEKIPTEKKLNLALDRMREMERAIHLLSNAVRRLAQPHQYDGGDKGVAGHDSEELGKEVEALISGSWGDFNENVPSEYLDYSDSRTTNGEDDNR